jgi:hypothetical protein
MRKGLLVLTVPMLLSMGWFLPPPKHIVYVQPGAVCAVPFELEVTQAWQVVARGLRVGDCVELDTKVAARLCCPTTPRTCGGPSVPIAKPVCLRTIRP